jgi:hypothetical protein
VKVKFIETQLPSSRPSVVQRLTDKSSPAVAPTAPQSPRPCRLAFASGKDAGSQQQPGWWSHEQQASNDHYLVVPAPRRRNPRAWRSCTSSATSVTCSTPTPAWGATTASLTDGRLECACTFVLFYPEHLLFTISESRPRFCDLISH